MLFNFRRSARSAAFPSQHNPADTLPAAPAPVFETLEPRTLLSAALQAASPPATLLAPAAAQAAPLADPALVIADDAVTIDAALAAQIVTALQQGRDVRVEAFDNLTVDAAIVVGDAAGSAKLDLIAGGNVVLNAGVSQTGTGRVDVTLSATASVVAPGSIVTRGRIHIDAFEDITLGGVVRSDANLSTATQDPSTGDPSDTAAVFVAAFGRADITGTVAATNGGVYASAVVLDVADGATVAANNGFVYILVEGIQTGDNSTIAATNGDVLLIGDFNASTVRGVIRATGSPSADVRLRAGTVDGKLTIASNALVTTAGGVIELAAREVNVDGRVLSNGGDILLAGNTLNINGTVDSNGGAVILNRDGGVADNATVTVTGTLASGSLTNERGGNLLILSNQGQVRIAQLIRTNGGDLTIKVTNGIDPTAQLNVATPGNADDFRNSYVVVSGVIDTRFGSGRGGDVLIDLDEADFILTTTGRILTGGGDVTVDARGGFHEVRVIGGQSLGVQFFPATVKLDGDIDTSSAFGNGTVRVPTTGAHVLLGTDSKSKFTLKTGSATDAAAFELSTAPAVALGAPPQLGSATIRTTGALATGDATLNIADQLALGGAFSAANLTVNAARLLIQRNTTLIARDGDLELDTRATATLAVNPRTRAHAARKKQRRPAAANLYARAANDINLTGNLAARGLLALSAGRNVHLTGDASALIARTGINLAADAIVHDNPNAPLFVNAGGKGLRTTAGVYSASAVRMKARNAKLILGPVVAAGPVFLVADKVRSAAVYANGPVVVKASDNARIPTVGTALANGRPQTIRITNDRIGRGGARPPASFDHFDTPIDTGVFNSPATLTFNFPSRSFTVDVS